MPRSEGVVAWFRALGRALQRIPRPVALLLVAAWCAVIWYASSRPAPSIETGGPWGEVLANFAHAPEYGVLVLGIALALPRRGGWPVVDRKAVVWTLALALLYAVLDEVHQAFTPDRDASALDVLTDFVGACATLACIVAAGDPSTSSRAFLRWFLLGLFACAIAAALSTFAPAALPAHSWL